MLTIDNSNLTFAPAVFLAHARLVQRIVELKQGENFFSQGDPADSISYLRHGRAKLTVISHNGKEATITLLGAGDFVGEGRWPLCLGSACAPPPPSTIA